MFRKRRVQFQPNGKSLERYALTSDRFLKVHLTVMRKSMRNFNTPYPTPWHNKASVQIPAVSGQNSVRMPYSIAGFVCQNAGAPPKEQSSSAPVVFNKAWD